MGNCNYCFKKLIGEQQKWCSSNCRTYGNRQKKKAKTISHVYEVSSLENSIDWFFGWLFVFGFFMITITFPATAVLVLLFYAKFIWLRDLLFEK